MKTFVRFGRRLPIPSMTEVRHELRAFSAAEDIRSECAKAEGLPSRASWDEIYAQRTRISPAAIAGTPER